MTPQQELIERIEELKPTEKRSGGTIFIMTKDGLNRLWVLGGITREIGSPELKWDTNLDEIDWRKQAKKGDRVQLQLSIPDFENDILDKSISTINTFLKDYVLVKNSEWRERWIYLSLFKCPNCNSKRVFGLPLDTRNIHDLHQIMVCYNCGWNKTEKVDTSDMRGRN